MLTDSKNYDQIRHILVKQTEFPDLDWSIYPSESYKLIKLFFKNSPYAGDYSWRYPFIDLIFFKKTSEVLWQENRPEFMCDLGNFFPLVMRPFGEWWLPAPLNPHAFFETLTYGNIEENCIQSSWNHKDESGQKENRISCNLLKNDYNFVIREILNSKNNSMKEYIIDLEKNLIKTIIFHN